MKEKRKLRINGEVINHVQDVKAYLPLPYWNHQQKIQIMKNLLLAIETRKRWQLHSRSGKEFLLTEINMAPFWSLEAKHVAPFWEQKCITEEGREQQQRLPHTIWDG